MSKKKPLDNQSRPLTFTPPENLKLAHDDLQYYFQYSDAECGIPSNYSALRFAVLNDISLYSAEEQFLDYIDKPRNERQISKSINRNRAIHQKFIKLSFRDQQIASLFNYEQVFDRSLEAHFGAGIKLIPFAPSFQKLPEQWRDLHKLQYCLIHHRKLIDKIKQETHELYLSVLEKYVQI